MSCFLQHENVGSWRGRNSGWVTASRLCTLAFQFQISKSAFCTQTSCVELVNTYKTACFCKQEKNYLYLYWQLKNISRIQRYCLCEKFSMVIYIEIVTIDCNEYFVLFCMNVKKIKNLLKPNHIYSTLLYDFEYKTK